MSIFLMFYLGLVLSIIFSLLGWVLYYKNNEDELNKMSAFECGMESKEKAHLPFSIRFFVLSIVFLVFDIELILLFPFILLMKWSIESMMLMGFLFLFILLSGLIYEVSVGGLTWMN